MPFRPSLALALALAAGSAAAAGAEPVDLRALAVEVAERINAYRESAGKPVFAPNDPAAKLARRHSRDMAKGRIDLGHDGMQERAEALVESVGIAKYAENVSRHDRDEGFVEAAVTRWLASPVHRKNIDGPFDATGVGAARAADGTIYFTQIFVKLR